MGLWEAKNTGDAGHSPRWTNLERWRPEQGMIFVESTNEFPAGDVTLPNFDGTMPLGGAHRGGRAVDR